MSVPAKARAFFDAPIETNKWHEIAFLIQDDQATVWIDGKKVGKFKSPGIDHSVKHNIARSVWGKAADIDDLRIWSLKSDSLAAMMPRQHLVVFRKYCFECHDSANAEGNINLEKISFQISQPQFLAFRTHWDEKYLIDRYLIARRLGVGDP